MQIVRQLKNNTGVVLPGVLICLGLLMRDAFNFEINKYVFLVLAAYPILCQNTNRVLIFISFLIPLYFGLPGNYISILILVRLIWDSVKNDRKINTGGLLLSLILSGYMFLTVLFKGHTDAYSLMGSIDFFILFLFVSLIISGRNEGSIIWGYAVGTVVLGAIMMTATLRHFTILDLMQNATRLGQHGVLQKHVESQMLTTIDPNFYGMYVIALVSSAYLMIKNKLYNSHKTSLIFLMVTSVILCLFGLSRTFLIILCLWGLITVVNNGSFKGLFSVVLLFIIIAFSIVNFFPELIDGFDRRMHDSTMEGGNGRVQLIVKHYSTWEKSVDAFLFGIGLYENNVHCGPLRYLFGIGIIGFLILTIWMFKIINIVKRGCRRLSYSKYIPLILTIIVFSTIPAAGSINAIFPLIISIIAIRL